MSKTTKLPGNLGYSPVFFTILKNKTSENFAGQGVRKIKKYKPLEFSD